MQLVHQNKKKKIQLNKNNNRKLASRQWLERHINDPFVQSAKKHQYRSRAAFKLLEIAEKFNIFRNIKSVIDLGCAPGSWLQIAKELAPNVQIIGIDLLETEPLDGIYMIKGSFLDIDVRNQILDKLGASKADLIMSDMAPASCGDNQIDHLRLMELVSLAVQFTLENLDLNGNFITKILRGGKEQQVLKTLKMNFKQVRTYKPQASYKNSAEIFIIALNFAPKKHC